MTLRNVRSHGRLWCAECKPKLKGEMFCNYSKEFDKKQFWLRNGSNRQEN